MNGSTTDDHVVHCVGFKEAGPDTWFLVKGSLKTAYQGPVKGYFFYRDDYLKLKVLMIMTHREAVADLLAKFPPANQSPAIEAPRLTSGKSREGD